MNDLRRKTRTVYIGNVAVGGANPVRIQTMLTSDTRDAEACLQEMQTLHDAEMIRLTLPNRQALEAVSQMRKKMSEYGITQPLIADVHFSPKIAVDACELFEKVRINPGNFADTKRFEVKVYTQDQYNEELERIEERLKPLIANLQKYKRSLRLGVNHGSLSDRILNHYGDTPEGMVECAMEYVRIFAKYNFHDIIISMKSSIPSVMMRAYRELSKQLAKECFDYPLHLGVTEAGAGLDGRIKSAVGIGGLLIDGIGDTVRVSLTEASKYEIPAAQAILDGVHQTQYVPPLTKPLPSRQAVQIGQTKVGEAFRLLAITPFRIAHTKPEYVDELINESQIDKLSIIHVSPEDLVNELQFVERLKLFQTPQLLVLSGQSFLFPLRHLAKILYDAQIAFPVAVRLHLDFCQWEQGASELGSAIIEGLLQALICPHLPPEHQLFVFCETLLQATRVRMSRADFISCPSCGRTFFDLQTTTKQIQDRTKHLKGVKIGIMGCIVNGPGEMADADFGYVGAGQEKIDLYYGQTRVQSGIHQSQAVEKLVELIQSKNMWTEPS